MTTKESRTSSKSKKSSKPPKSPQDKDTEDRLSEDMDQFSYGDIFHYVKSKLAFVSEILAMHEDNHYKQAEDYIEWCMKTMDVVSNSSLIKHLTFEGEDTELMRDLEKFSKEGENHSTVAKHLTTVYSRSKIKHPVTKRTSVSMRQPSNFLNTETIDMDDMDHLTEPMYINNLNNIMGKLDIWGCDIFSLEHEINNPLTNVLYFLMLKRNLFKSLELPFNSVLNVMNKIEANYHNENSYHNAIHAVDVTQTTHTILAASPLTVLFSDLEIFAILFASAIHDVDHPGVNNQYLINTKSPLAILYNDQSILENHHSALAFKMIYDEKNNFLSYLTEANAKYFRSIVIQMIQSTDMTFHVKVTSVLQLCLDHLQTLPLPLTEITKSNERIDVMCGILHFADISNPTKPLEMYQQWEKRLYNEFFQQGDLEKSRGILVSPMCDRETADRAKGQIGFIDYIVRPLTDVIVRLFSLGEEKSNNFGKQLLEHLRENHKFYSDLSGHVVISEGKAMGNFSENADADRRYKGYTHKVPTIIFKTPFFFQVKKLESLHWNKEEND